MRRKKRIQKEGDECGKYKSTGTFVKSKKYMCMYVHVVDLLKLIKLF